MALFLTEAEVTELLTMPAAMEAVESAMRDAAAGGAVNRPRDRARTPGGVLHVMGAAWPARGVAGSKTYLTTGSGARFHALLYSFESGELLAMFEADRLGQQRTGAASGVATRYMARPSADTLALFGAGWQAESQLEAIHFARPLRRVFVCGRSVERRDSFCRRMQERLGIPVIGSDEPESAVARSEIVTIMTSSGEPVLRGEWLRPGTHVNAAGSNSLARREIDLETVRRADRIVVDSREQAARESGDLLPAVEGGLIRWDGMTELSAVVADPALGRPSDDAITLFESHGLALWDVAVAARVLEERVRRARPGG